MDICLAHEGGDQFQVRVHKLQKVYWTLCCPESDEHVVEERCPLKYGKTEGPIYLGLGLSYILLRELTMTSLLQYLVHLYSALVLQLRSDEA